MLSFCNEPMKHSVLFEHLLIVKSAFSALLTDRIFRWLVPLLSAASLLRLGLLIFFFL